MESDDKNKIRDTCLMVLTAIALTGAFIYTKAVLVPLVFAIFITMMVTPVLNWLQTTLKIRRFLAVAITIVALVIATSALAFFLSVSINRFLEDADVYRERLIRFSNDVILKFEGLGFTGGLGAIKNELSQFQFFRLFSQVGGGLLSFTGNLVLVIIFSLFLILGSAQGQKKKDTLLDKAQKQINRYISVKIIVSLATAVLTALVLFALGVELAFMFAVLTFLLNFIPSVGSIAAVLLPLPIIMLQFGLSWQVAVALGTLGSLQFTIGNLVEPKFMGEAMNLHPVTILVFLIFWGLVWGLPGMFLAVPLTATLRLLFENMKPLQPLARLMAGEVGR